MVQNNDGERLCLKKKEKAEFYKRNILLQPSVKNGFSPDLEKNDRQA